MRVFDTSNLAYGVQETVSVAVFQKFKAAGFDMLMLGLHGGGSPNYRARETLSNAKAAGLLTAGYAVIVPGRAADIIRSARGYADTAWPYLEFMVVDVEWEQQTLSVGDVQEAVNTVEQLGQKACIYCVSPETRILTRDLRWIAAEELREGDNIVGFQEEVQKWRYARHFQEAVVTGNGMKKLPCYDISLASGERLRASHEHRWLIRSNSGRPNVWATASEMRKSLTHPLRTKSLVIPRFLPVCTPQETYKDGFLAAAFDGEGHLMYVDNCFHLGFSQKQNAFLKQVCDYLTERQYMFTQRDMKQARVEQVRLNGGRAEVLRFLMECRPPRLLTKWLQFPIKKAGMRRIECVPIERIEDVGEQWVATLSSSSQTYLAEGYGSHNTYRDYWQGCMGNPVDCANIPLIDADYPGKGKAGRPTLDMAFPYGGWTRRAGHQYQDTHDEFGIDVDCDLIDDTMLRHVGTEDDNMTDQQKQALDLMVGIGWNGREREELGNLITREAEYRKVQVPQLTARVDQLTKRLTDVKGLMQSIKQTAVEVETTLESGTG